MITILNWRRPGAGIWKLAASVLIGCPLLVWSDPTQDPPKTPKPPPPQHIRPVRVRYARNAVRHHPPAQVAHTAPAAAPVIVVPIDPATLARERAEYLAALAAASAAADARHQQALIGVDARVAAFLKEQTETGSVFAPFDLAEHYRTGKGVEVNPTEADRLVRLAAERGNEDAKSWLRDHRPSGSNTGEQNPPQPRS